MEVFECKYCKSKNLMLESRVSGENVMTANMVALKCADCGKWIKWCPKEDRHFYIKEKIFTFTKEQLDQHDAEVRAEEKKKVVAELQEWANSKMMDWINHPKYREPHFRGTRIIHYYDLQQKLNELKGE